MPRVPRSTHTIPSEAPPLVAVCWVDANYPTTDTPIADLGELVTLYEVGFLLLETPTSIVISCEYQPYATTSRLALTIPKNCIVWRQPLDVSIIKNRSSR